MYLNPLYSQFWEFSWDEFAEYDFPAGIDYVKQQTAQEKLIYVGHSEGTTQFFAAISSNPTYATTNIACFVGLGPVATVGNITCTFFRDMAEIHLDTILHYLGFEKGFIPLANKLWLRKAIALMSWLLPGMTNDILKMMCGKPQDGSVLTRGILPQFVENEPGGTSMKNITKWCQGVRNGKFEKFDYGPTLNQKRYGSETPPLYDLTQIPAALPKALFYGSNDQLADPVDVANLISQLPGKPYTQELVGYDHVDYLWDPTAYITLYPTLLQWIQANAEY